MHYKLKELELQTNGRNAQGSYIGTKNRDEAQKLILGNDSIGFDDCRSYEIISKILEDLDIKNEKFVLLSESQKKINSLRENIDIIKYSDYHESVINCENVSEYLVKILNYTHNFEAEDLDKIIEIVENRQCNDRTFSTLMSIINRINNDNSYELPDELKEKFLRVYNKIVCGDEKKYIMDDNIIKIQNNFSCKVNSSVFKAIKKVYGSKVFDRISLEKLYYFESKKQESSIRIRTSKILNTVEEKCVFLKDQIHVEQRVFSDENKQILQNEISLSKLRSLFEDNNYDYVKKVEMITIISEKQIPGINIYIKKLPNIENRIMDIYGKAGDIQKFIQNLSNSSSRNVFNSAMSDINYENENFAKYNLRFANMEAAIQEELEIYELINREE